MKGPNLKDVEADCRKIYQLTRSFHKRIAPQMGEANLGFKILYGPPIVEPPNLFIGYQPGGKKESMIESEHQKWPEACEYVTAEWRLAKVLRKVFDLEVLEACVGTNAILFRAPDYGTYQKLSRQLRQKIERFCRDQVEDLIAALRPKRIVFIGLKTMTLFVDQGADDLVSDKGRVLTRTSIVAGCPALGIIHLSGARISKADRLRIEDRLASGT